MSKQNLEKTLREELDILNDQIDRKIIRGLSYAREARRHKFILSRINELRKAQHSSWFGRSFAFASSNTFIF